MKIYTSYSVKIKTYNKIFRDTVRLYRAAVDFFIGVCLSEWDNIVSLKNDQHRQRLHLWRANYVQAMVADKAHRLGMHISRVCAWGTSKLAYDGSGSVERGINGNYSICKFQNGKTYHCDLSASYNIGARYFIREILKSLPETVRLGIQAKVPECTKRTTCTFSTLISLNAALAA